MLFVVPHAYRDPDHTPQLPLERLVDFTVEVRAGWVRFAPTLPAAVQARYGPLRDPISPLPEGATLDQHKAHVLAEVLTPTPPRYVAIADDRTPDEIHRWLAADPDAVMTFTWITADSYDALVTDDGLARVHLVVRAVETTLQQSDANAREDQ